ncbi:hypothetical protein ACN68I_07295 [Aerococcus viridans]|uniref:hypothetical protein n=1 Tax=Aerococcus viridans TaxID=1377 RepID=UPI003B223F91
MKNIKKIIFTIFSFFIVSACSNPSVKEDLQENNWEFVQSDGVTGEIKFSNDLVVFTAKDLPISDNFNYQLNDEETEIIMTKIYTAPFSDEKRTREIKYSIQKNDGEYTLSLISDNLDNYEDGFTITLIPQEVDNTSEN